MSRGRNVWKTFISLASWEFSIFGKKGVKIEKKFIFIIELKYVKYIGINKKVKYEKFFKK